MAEAKSIFARNTRMFALYAGKIADCKSLEEFNKIKTSLENYKAERGIK